MSSATAEKPHKLPFWTTIDDHFEKYVAVILQHSCLPGFTWWRVMLYFFNSNQLFRNSCIWWCCFSKLSSIVPYLISFMNLIINCSFYFKMKWVSITKKWENFYSCILPLPHCLLVLHHWNSKEIKKWKFVPYSSIVDPCSWP